MNVMEAVRNGEYKTKLVSPDQVAQPALMRKRPVDMTPDELAALPAAVEAYKAAKEEAVKARAAYRDDIARLEAKFRTDLEAEYGMTGNPKAAKLFSLAWEYGHSAGLGEVAMYYDDLVELAR